LHRMAKESTGYNVQLMDTHHKMTDPGQLEIAFKKLIMRHESLRTSFTMIAGEAVQRIHPQVPFQIEYYESSEGRTDQENRRGKNVPLDNTRNRRRNRQERRNGPEPSNIILPAPASNSDIPVAEIVKGFVRPFDLNQPPLMRVGVITIRKIRQILLMDMHHVICDGVSVGVFLEELRAILEGESLPPLKLQYKDFSQWAATGRQKDRLEQQETFWLKTFAGQIPLLDLPSDFITPREQDHQGDTLYFEIGPEETGQLNKLAKKEGATLYMILLAIYNILLARLSGQEDIVVGTVTAGRKHSDLREIIGVFVNTLALRNYPLGHISVNRFLKEVKESTLAAFDNQDYPFENLVAKTAEPRDAERSPLFDVSFILQNQADKTGYMQELMVVGKSKPYHFEVNQAKFMITLMGVETAVGIEFSLEYNAQRLREETVNRFIDYFKTITTAVCRDPRVALGEIEIMPLNERERLLYEFNDTRSQYPTDTTIHRLFEEQVTRTPDAIALVGPSGPEMHACLSYQGLDDEADGTAWVLAGKGAGPGSIVAIMAERSLEMITGLIGILKTGAAYLPIDPAYPEERIDYILKDSGAGVLVSGLDSLEVRRLDGTGGPTNKPINQPTGKPTDLAYIIYTSGTTGWPKGVMVEHGGVANMLLYRKDAYKFEPGARALQLFSYAFDGFVTSFFTPVISGARVVLISDQWLKDIIRIKEVIINHGITHFISVPALYGAIIESLIPAEALSLQVVTLAGDKVPPDILKLTVEKNPNLELAHEYGVTEASVMSTLYRHMERNPFIKIGSPIANTALFILNRYGKLQPIGVPGELCISGAGIARGYLNRPQLTSEKFASAIDKSFTGRFTDRGAVFQKSPLAAGGMIYKTGDLARWLPDGNIEFLGRIDHQVKVKGFRIEVGEIENQLLTHPGVKEAVVLAHEESNKGKYLSAYYVAGKTESASKLPELWPSVAEFFVYDELLYYAMTHDERRNASYKVAIDRLVKDKVVVEVGTGQDAILSRFCAEAGAAKIYAIEMMDESYKKARRKIKQLGLQHKITLIYGDATKVQLPEKADVCVSEIVGS
ncbi:MAG: amino acid adenylation domain-containing protein, partial [bacterium]|nr:amino acid adenylation domain-containing protein [bacterium]